MSKKSITLIAIIMAFIMLFVTTPENVHAYVANIELPEIKIANNNTKHSSLTESEEENAYIILEDKSKRGFNEKHYLMSDGTFYMEQYAQPVHYFEGNEYKEIDNSLILTKDKEGNDVYKNKSNSFNVNFSKTIEENSLLSISKEDYNINMSLIGLNTLLGYDSYNGESNAKSVNNSINISTINMDSKELYKEKKEIDYKLQKYETPINNQKLSSELRYNNVLKDIDLEYEILPSGIKENIVINMQKENYSFLFNLEVENLNLILNESTKEIYAYSKNDPEKIIFIIPAPFMYDDKGETSFDVKYELSKTNNSNYVINVIADEKWINNSERAFPVIVDPMITFEEKTNFEYANVFEDNINTITSNLTNGVIGSNYDNNFNFNNVGFSTLYLKFSVPDQKYNTLLHASFSFNSVVETYIRGDLMVYAVDWIDNMSTLTWQYPNYSQNIYSLQMWYNQNLPLQTYINSHNVVIPTRTFSENGVCLRIGFDNQVNNCYVKINLSNNAPVLNLLYKPILGIEESYEMESAETDYTKNYINLITGALTSVIDFMTVNNNIMPLSISGIYNCGDIQYSDLMGSTSYPYGKNFKLNVQQYLRPITVGQPAQTIGYEYIDADGTPHYFYPEGELGFTNRYRTTTNKDLLLRSDQSTIHDGNGNRLVFYDGLLVVIYNKDNNYIIINYVNGLVNRISFSQSNKRLQFIDFSYDNNKLSSMTSYLIDNDDNFIQGDIAYFEHSGNYLTGVKNSNNYYKAKIEYNNDFIVKILNDDNTGIEFGITPVIYPYRTIKQLYKNDSTTEYETEFRRIFFEYYETKVCYYHDYGRSYINYFYDNSGRFYSKRISEKEPYNNQDNKAIITYIHNNNTYTIKEDLTSVPNGSFQFISNGQPDCWSYTNQNSLFYQDHYGFRDSDHGGSDFVMRLNAGSNATNLGFSIVKEENKHYALTAFIRGGYNYSELSIQIDNNNGMINETIIKNFQLNSNKQIPIFIPIPLSNGMNSLYITIKNSAQSNGHILINNVTISEYSDTINHTSNSTINHYISQEVNTSSNYKENIKTKETIHILENSQLYRRLIQSFKIEDLTNDTVKITDYEYYNNYNHKLKSITTTLSKGNISQKSITEYLYTTNSSTGEKTVTAITKYFDSIAASIPSIQKQNISVFNKLGYLINNIDENGIETSYVYGIYGNNYNLREYHRGDYQEVYNYDTNGNLISVNNGDNYTFSYNGLNLIGYGTSDNSYTYSTDNFGYITGININNSQKIGYNYTNQILTGKTFSNGDFENYIFNNDGYISKKTHSGGVEYEYQYDSINRVTDISVNQNNNTLLNYNYSGHDNNTQKMISITGTNHYANYTYNYNNITKNINNIQYNLYGNTYTTTFGYDNFMRLNSTSTGNINSNITYNDAGMLNNYTIKHGSTVLNQKQYNYSTFTNSGTTYTKNQIDSITDSMGSHYYTYDNKGNITDIQSDNTAVSYNYNNINQLIVENNQNFVSGNERYAEYNYYNNNLSNAYQEDYYDVDSYSILDSAYYYNNDRLDYIQVNGYLIENGNYITSYYGYYTFSYDAMGNPITYMGNHSTQKTMSWTQGRLLSNINGNGNTASYKYDANGIRYQKTVNGINTYYYLEGNNIIAENRNGNLIYYIYDMTGIAGMVYNGNTYVFRKNIFGDVVQIVNTNGNVVAEYQYDAWGNIISQSGYMAEINPFRYRGYYYDEESGFYYLNTRYYDPYVRRFVNADNYELLPILAQVPGQLSLYTYCNNNPVMYIDPNGEEPLTLIFWGSVALLSLLGIIHIETQFHPIENTITFIINGIEKLGNSIYNAIGINSNNTSIAQIDNSDYYYSKKVTYKPERRGVRVWGKSKKDAQEKARARGFGKPPIFHSGKYKNGEWRPRHYHPNVPPKHPFSHDHYYYSWFLWQLLWED